MRIWYANLMNKALGLQPSCTLLVILRRHKSIEYSFIIIKNDCTCVCYYTLAEIVTQKSINPKKSTTSQCFQSTQIKKSKQIFKTATILLTYTTILLVVTKTHNISIYMKTKISSSSSQPYRVPNTKFTLY